MNERMYERMNELNDREKQNVIAMEVRKGVGDDLRGEVGRNEGQSRH